MTSDFTDLSGGGSQQVWLSVTRTSQSITNNTSTYSYELRYYGNGYGSWTGSTLYWSVDFSGGQTNTGSFTIPSSEAYQTYKTLTSGTFVKTHNSDGTFGSFSCVGTIDASAHSNIGTGSASFTEPAPPTIARASQPSLNAGGTTVTTSSPTQINMNRASTSFTHTVTWSFGSLTNQTGGLTGSGLNVGTDVSWTPPDTMLLEIPDDTSGTGTITVVTKSGSTTIGTKTLSITVKAATTVKPVITSVTLAEQTASVTTNVGAYVQTLSVLKGTVNATVAQGSPITDRDWATAGKTVTSGSNITLTASGTVAVTGAVTDSRGRTGAYSTNITVLSYTKPAIVDADVDRCTSAGVKDDNGTYLLLDMNATVKSLKPSTTEKNVMTVTVSTRAYGSSTWTVRDTFSPTAPAVTWNSTRIVAGGGIYSIATSYEVLIKVSDKFNTAQKILVIPTADVFMHWSTTGVGIGKYHENGRLDVDGSAHFRNSGGTVELNLSGTDDTRAVRLQFKKSNSIRMAWVLSGSETGSNAGSDIQLFRYDDTGTYIANALTFYRNTGDVHFAAKISSPGKTFAPQIGNNGYVFSPAGGGVLTRDDGNPPLYLERSTVGRVLQFTVGTAFSGWINLPTSGGTPAFAAGSDYRLKEDIKPVTDAIERMRQIKAVTFHRLANPGSEIETGFLAHELALAQPDAVIGEKDAVDENGEPIYQEVMEAKLIPLMAQAIRDLIDIVVPEGEK